MNQELKKLGKNGDAVLLYQAIRDGLSSETLWANCKNHKETIVLVQTDLNSVIGCYCPEKWENTTEMKSSFGCPGYKDITSDKPFLFYCLDNQIQIIKHKDRQIPRIGSNKDFLMVIGGGLYIYADKNIKSAACADKKYFERS